MGVTRSYGGVPAKARREARRQRLLDAGYDLLAVHGPTNVTVTGVCDRAGLTARYFYESFQDRDALLAGIFDNEAAAVTGELLDAALAGSDDPRTRARAAVSALLKALESDPRRARLGLGSQHDDALLRRRVETTSRLAALLAENAELLWPYIAAPTDRVALACEVVVAGVIEIVIGYLAGRLHASADDVADLCARFAIEGGAALVGRGADHGVGK